MLTKIQREECIKKYPKFPTRHYEANNDEEIISYPKVFKSYVLTVPGKTFRGHVSLLGKELVRLMSKMDIDSLVFLGDTKTSWRFQDNNYGPVKSALQYLENYKVGKRFNGAIKIDLGTMPTFIKHLSWMTRCNAALPYIYFSDEGQNFIGNICQYSNLHFDILNKKTDNVFKTLIAFTSFQQSTTNCINQFAINRSIGGRQIIA